MEDFTFASAVLRLLLAMAAGAAVGYGRSKKERAAGMRTYMLISIGAAMSVLLPVYQYHMLMGPWAETVSEVGFKYDTGRLMSQSITGIGFLGAGIIIKGMHQQVKGLTTATGLFATVCMGIAAGAGFYEMVLIASALVVLVLNVMSPLESAYKRRLRNITLYVEFDSVEDIGAITDMMRQQHAQIFDIDIERTERKDELYPCATFIIRLSRENHSHSGMLSSLAELSCVRSVRELIA